MKKEEILRQLNFVQIYGHYFPELKGTAGWENVNSPFREDKEASFSINLDTGGFNDFGDPDSHGDIFAFIQQKERLPDFKETLIYTCDNFAKMRWEEPKNRKTEKPKESKKKQAVITSKQMDIYIANLQNRKFPQLNEVIEGRKISLDLCRQFGIGAGHIKYRDKNGQFYEFDTLIFPYEFDAKGNVIRFKKIPYLNKKSQKKFSRALGSATVWPSEMLMNKRLVICEGELDCLSLLSNGINAITGTTGIRTFINNRLLIDNFKSKDIILIFDTDKPGEHTIDEFTKRTAEQFIHICDTVKIAKWDRPIGGYDVGDFFEEGRTVPELMKILDNARLFEYKKDNAEIRERISKFIYTEKLNLMQNIFCDYLFDDYYRDLNNNLTLASTIIGAKRFFFLYKNGFWRRTNKEVVKRHVYRLLKHPFTANTVNSVVDLLLSRVYTDYEDFNSRADLINLNNCTFDLVNYKAVPHSPEFYFTFKNSYNYDPVAKSPVWDKAMAEYAMNDAAWMACMWEIFGYSLTGAYDIQKMFWWEGPGGTGKSTATRVLQNLVGYDLTRFNFNPQNLTGRFYNKELIGKRIAITGDLDNYLMNINIIKQLTGGDKQTTDVKHGDEVVFENTAKIIFCMNTLPQIPAGESIQPFLRRILLLPFHQGIKKYDFGIEKKFEAELPGIFNKAIAGLKRLRLNKNEYTFVPRGDRMLRFYEKNINMFESFCTDEIIEENGASVFNYEIWERYKKYMDERAASHWDSDRINIRSLTHLGSRIKNKYKCETERKSAVVKMDDFSAIRKGQYTLYHGLRLADDSDYENNEQKLIDNQGDVPF